MKFARFIPFLIMVLGWQAFGADYRGADIVQVAAGDTVPTDLFGAGQSIFIDGVVNGDVYAGGETFTINGKIKEDALGFCRRMNVYGDVEDMVLFFGKRLTIRGHVAGDVLAFGGEVHIAEGARIDGSLFIGTGNLNMEGGTVAGNVSGGAGRIYLNGDIGGDVDLEAGFVRFGDDYRAGGVTHLTLPEELDKEEAGNVPANLEITVKERRKFYQRWFFYWSMIALLVTGVLMVSLFKNFTRDIITFASRAIGKSLGVGFVTLIVVPVVALILLLLVVTIPVSLIAMAVYFMALYLAKVFTALFIGNYLLETMRRNGVPPNLFLALLLGVIFVMLLPQLPFIGWLMKLAIVSFGLGGMVVYVWNFKQNGAAQTS